jgi:hypothetical protein
MNPRSLTGGYTVSKPHGDFSPNARETMTDAQSRGILQALRRKQSRTGLGYKDCLVLAPLMRACGTAVGTKAGA